MHDLQGPATGPTRGGPDAPCSPPWKGGSLAACLRLGRCKPCGLYRLVEFRGHLRPAQGDHGRIGGRSAAGAGHTVSFAELPGNIANYIFPLTSGEYDTAADISLFQFLMYPPLYWYGTAGRMRHRERSASTRP